MRTEILALLVNSWPLAIMFLGAIVGGIVLYWIRWMKKEDQEDKAYRASQAVIVRDRSDR